MRSGRGLSHAVGRSGSAPVCYTRVALADLAQVLERSHAREREWARRGGRAR